SYGSLPALSHFLNLSFLNERTDSFADKEGVPFGMLVNLASEGGAHRVSCHAHQELLHRILSETFQAQLFGVVCTGQRGKQASQWVCLIHLFRPVEEEIKRSGPVGTRRTETWSCEVCKELHGYRVNPLDIVQDDHE